MSERGPLAPPPVPAALSPRFELPARKPWGWIALSGVSTSAFGVSLVLFLLKPTLVPPPVVVLPPPIVVAPAPAPVHAPFPLPPDARDGEDDEAAVAPVDPRQNTGQFACATRPMGAAVWVDGKNSNSKTPISLSRAIDLPAGPHEIVFKFNGRQSEPHRVMIRPGEVTKLIGVSF